MEVGTRVKLTALQKTFNGACAKPPHVGLTGVVVSDSFTPAGKTAVEFDSFKLGYLDAEPITYYIENDTMEAWTVLDEYVRLAMFSYPMLHPNRMAVLRHSFLVNGNGVGFGADGKLPTAQYETSMQYDDLDERLAEYTTGSFSKLGGTILEGMKAELAAERAERQRKEANIYELACASTADVKFGDGGYYEKAANLVSHVKGGYLTINRMPKKVERSCFNGALEVLDAVARSTAADDPALAELLQFRADLIARHEVFSEGPVAPAAPRVVEPIAETAKIMLRESNPCGYVCVLIDGKETRRFSEYRSAAEHVQRAYGLSDGELMELYHDYKADYENED